MKRVVLEVEDYLYDFYRQIGSEANNRSAEEVMSDALLRLAGELALNAIAEKNNKKK